MGIVEKIGRKLTGSQSKEISGTSKPSGSSSPNGVVDGRAPQYKDHQGKCYTRHGYVHPDAVKEQPRIVQTTAIVGSKDDPFVASPPRSKAVQNQPFIASPPKSKAVHNQAQRCTHHVPMLQQPPQPPPKNIAPPISRLADSTTQETRPPPTTSRPFPNSPPRTQPSLHKQPSIASSLHSARSVNRQGQAEPPRSRANTLPGRPPGMSTKRMEDSAYHAGFRDAVAQLEREGMRERMGRGAAVGVR